VLLQKRIILLAGESDEPAAQVVIAKLIDLVVAR
jgi:hypothetical protein